MNAAIQAGNFGDFAQQESDAVAAVKAMVLVGHAADLVACMRHLVEIVALCSQAELELDSAPSRLPADEFESLKVSLARQIRKAFHPDRILRRSTWGCTVERHWRGQRAPGVFWSRKFPCLAMAI